MNIQDITAGQKPGSARSTAFGARSFLSIGKKNQIVEGIVSKVSEQVSIDFQGVEVSVSSSSVPNAKEGEKRQFQIMDVSKDHIVLKELGRTDSVGEARALMGTTVGFAGKTFSDTMASAMADSGKVAEAKQEAAQNITLVTGEDYRELESDLGALEEYKASALDRAVEKHKEKRLLQQEISQKHIEGSEKYREQLARMQTMGFSDLKSQQAIAAALEEAGLPASEANISRVATALQMAEIVPELSGDAKAFILENQAVPSIENLYQGQYSGANTVSGDFVDPEVWEQLEPQVRTLLQEQGMVIDPSVMEQAKWLFANDLPITSDNLQSLEQLEQLQAELTPDKVLERVIQAMQLGVAPEQASLDDTQIVTAVAVIRDFQTVNPADVRRVLQVADRDSVTLALLKQVRAMEEAEDDDDDFQDMEEEFLDEPEEEAEDLAGEYRVYRQLEEIRLKMTLQSAVSMANKGIEIEVTPLKSLVEELRIQEKDYFQALMPETEFDAEELSLTQETLVKATDIGRAPAQILGGFKRQQLVTVNILHRAATSASVQMKQYQEDFEAVRTQASPEYGDSIKKAFANVPQLLEELSMEVTPENERAVRILGYNQMEITQESVTYVKGMDARVNSILDQMKPSVVLELVRQGKNPLNMPLEELDQTLREISAGQDISSEERYSRYLWRLEQDGSISAQERDGYIGVYRLLHQIDASDGAAVGAVINSGRTMNLANLLSAVRTGKGRGVNKVVDDQFAEQPQHSHYRNSITEQIENGFADWKNDQDSSRNRFPQERSNQLSGSEPVEASTDTAFEPSADPELSSLQQEYYQRLVRRTLELLTPEALQRLSEEEEAPVLQLPLERLAGAVQQFEMNPELQTEEARRIEKELYNHLAEELRTTMTDHAELIQYLAQLDIPDHPANVRAAEEMLQEGFDLYREIGRRRKGVTEKDREKLRESFETMTDAMENEDTMQAACLRTEAAMERILERTYDVSDITYEDLRHLTKLSRGMLLQSQRARREHYDIPIETEDGFATLNVTLIQGSGDDGRVEVFYRGDPFDQEAKTVSAELRLTGRTVRGMVLCASADEHRKLSEQDGALQEKLEHAGFDIKNISYGIDGASPLERQNAEQRGQVPTVQLYRLAKQMVKHFAEVLSAE